ncbi:hypothetical protein IRJ41_015457, partial [Triplophysa rosa]
QQQQTSERFFMNDVDKDLLKYRLKDVIRSMVGQGSWCCESGRRSERVRLLHNTRVSLHHTHMGTGR